MVRPQSEELNRSGKTPLDPDSIGGNLDAHDRPHDEGRTGTPVPPDNRPGHHPDVEQDQPDPDEFVARFSGEQHDASTARSNTARVADVATTAATAGVRFTTTLAGSAWRVVRATAQAIRVEVDAVRNR
jgi:hypothetical protein